MDDRCPDCGVELIYVNGEPVCMDPECIEADEWAEEVYG